MLGLVALALRIALWIVVLLVPGGVLALPLLVAHHTRKAPLAKDAEAPSSELVGPLSQA
jgi:hypothetical protein